jgi:uncharacterized protein (DUF2147 family)
MIELLLKQHLWSVFGITFKRWNILVMTMKSIYLFCMFALCSALNAQTVEGFWKRINAKTENTQCIISIYKYQGKYYGRIIGTFDPEGKMKENLYAPEDRAEKVSGSPYYCGMDLLWDLQESGSKYRGKIVDPRSGKVYDAVIWNKDGNLIVRGELFFIGRNETWFPIEEGDFPSDFKKPDLTKFIPITH